MEIIIQRKFIALFAITWLQDKTCYKEENFNPFHIKKCLYIVKKFLLCYALTFLLSFKIVETIFRVALCK